MSRFTEQDAARLAILAVRPRNGQTEEEAQQNAPLLGKEAALLEALRAAERAHDEAMREARSDAEWLEDLKSSRERHRVFFKYIDAALAEWRNMDGETRLGLAWHAHSTGSNGGDCDETSSYLDAILARFDASLGEMHRAAHSASSDIEFSPGRKKGISQSVGANNVPLAPLEAFVGVLRDFWRSTAGEKFTVEFGEVVDSRGIRVTEPKSAAARLVFVATEKLTNARGKRLYEMGTVENAMRRARANSPDFLT